jgi:hypothetical protein
LTIQKNEADWQVIPDIKMSSTDNIQQLIDEWRHARALRLSKLDADSVPKDTDTIEVYIADHQPLRFSIVRTDDEIILSRHDIGLRYHLTTEAGEKLLSLARQPSEPKAEEEK